jgi:hypothetical protein
VSFDRERDVGPAQSDVSELTVTHCRKLGETGSLSPPREMCLPQLPDNAPNPELFGRGYGWELDRV